MDIEQLKSVFGLILNVLMCLLAFPAGWAFFLLIRDLRRAERERQAEETQSRNGYRWPDPSRN